MALEVRELKLFNEKIDQKCVEKHGVPNEELEVQFQNYEPPGVTFHFRVKNNMRHNFEET